MRYHVEFEVESEEEWDTTGSDPTWTLDGCKDMDGYMLFIPADALISDITSEPKLEAGWYRAVEKPFAAVVHWDLEVIEEYGEADFRLHFERMKDPEVYDA